LQRRHFRRGRRLIVPGHAFEHQQLFGAGFVPQVERKSFGDAQAVAGPAVVRNRDASGRRAIGSDDDVLRAG
jgi:hypothetical protein